MRNETDYTRADLRTEILALREQIQSLSKNITEIRSALLGSEMHPNAGLIYRMADIESEQQKTTESIKRQRWYLAGATSGAAALSTILQLVL
jgi:hypothetical protein